MSSQLTLLTAAYSCFSIFCIHERVVICILYLHPVYLGRWVLTWIDNEDRYFEEYEDQCSNCIVFHYIRICTKFNRYLFAFLLYITSIYCYNAVFFCLMVKLRMFLRSAVMHLFLCFVFFSRLLYYSYFLAIDWLVFFISFSFLLLMLIFLIIVCLIRFKLFRFVFTGRF